MNNLRLEATKSTPFVSFDAALHQLLIEGQSYPENAAFFYQPLYDWIKDFLPQSNGQITVILKLIFINTSSSKALMKFFDMLEEAVKSFKKDITVNWYCAKENEIARECGEDFASDLDLPFNIIEIES